MKALNKLSTIDMKASNKFGQGERSGMKALNKFGQVEDR